MIYNRICVQNPKVQISPIKKSDSNKTIAKRVNNHFTTNKLLNYICFVTNAT